MSPDAVKQRLARGRKLLQEEVTAFVEGALQRSAPGKAFTLAVLASLPVFVAGSAAAATVGTTTATTAAKTVTATGLAGAILGPLLGLVGGAFGVWMSIKNTASARERQFMIRQGWISAGLVAGFLAALFSLIFLGGLGGGTAGALAWLVAQAIQTSDWITATVVVVFGAVVVLVSGGAWMRHPERRLRTMCRTLAALGLFTAAVGAVHWRDWTEAAGVQTGSLRTVLIGAGLTAIAVLAEMFILLRRSPPCIFRVSGGKASPSRAAQNLKI